MTWNFPPSCFRRKELWVLVNGEKRAVHKDAVQFDLTGLEPETTYTVYMVTGYEGGEMSDKAPVTFTTTAGNVSFTSVEPVLKAHRTLSVQASVFERRVRGDTRFYCSAQCAGFVPLGSSFLSLPPGVRITRRVE